MMAEKKEPQSFALILADADAGTVNDELSRRYEAMREKLTDLAYFHEDTFTGEFTLKVKLSVEGKKGNLTWKVDATTKLPPQKMPGARFFTDAGGRQTSKDPRTAGPLIPGLDEAREKKNAAGPRTPKMASDQ